MTAPFRSKLWIDYILQIAENQPFVMSALVALSITHESYSQDPVLRDRYRSDAIRHYNKAMREICNFEQTEQSVYAVLVSSIVFYSLESLRGCFYRALQHAQSGVKIVSQHLQLLLSKPSMPSQLAESLHRDFLALQNQTMELGSPGRSRAFDTIRGFDPVLPISFDSLEDAMYYVEVIYNEIFCTIEYCETLAQYDSIAADAVATSIGPRYASLCGKLEQWNAAFSSVPERYDPQQRQAVLMLSIYQLQLQVVMENIFTGECFERFDPDIARLLDLIELFLQNEMQSTSDDQHAFSLSLGIIPLLFMLAHRCNYIPTRDKCLEMLRLNRRREGAWDSATALQVAQRIIAVRARFSTTETHGEAKVDNIAFVSETTIQIDFTVPVSMAPTGGWLISDGMVKQGGHVEIVELNPIQFLD